MTNKRYLITAGLPYSNGRLHVGHIAGAYLPADTWVRYRRACGDDVRFVCGSDDNGVTALIAARKEGKTPEELTAYYNASQARDFAGLGIEFDVYGGTHQPDFVEQHNRICQEFFLTIHEKGYFTKKTSTQLYDAEANQFLPDRFVKGTCYHKKEDGSVCGYAEAYGDQCEACGNAIDPMELIDPESTITGTKPEPRETTHWHLRLDEFEDRLREWLESKRQASDENPAWREMVLNFSLGQIKSGLPERAMTRDLEWGVPVPLDDPDAKGKALYVWFDAPIGYVSFTANLCARTEGDATNYARWFKDPDCRIVHFVGEDNTIFHTLTWPAMMLAEGSYQLPWQVIVNHFLNIKFPGKDETKVSKSRGTAVWIEDFLQTFDADPLRYYLTAIAPESARTAFDFDDLINRNNSELLAAFGNFVNRTMSQAHRHFEGKVPGVGERGDVDLAQLAEIQAAADRTAAQLEAFHFKAALGEAMGLARSANKYMDDKKPWKTVKNEATRADAATTINVALQTVRGLATLLAPFLPASGAKCAQMLVLEGDLPEALPWSEAAKELPAGTTLGDAVMLIKKLDRDKLFAEEAD